MSKQHIELMITAKHQLEKGWCKGAVARDAFGKEVGALQPSAVSWCILGAMSYSTDKLLGPIRPSHSMYASSCGIILKSIVDDQCDLVNMNDNAQSVDEVIRLINIGMNSIRDINGHHQDISHLFDSEMELHAYCDSLWIDVVNGKVRDAG